MSEEKKPVQNENNIKLLVTIVIVLVVLLAVAVFSLQQNKNNASQAGDTASNTANTSGSAQVDTGATKDAGSLSKNEVKLTNDNFKAEVEDYKGVVLVDFYLSTCPHCQNVAADVSAVADEMVGKIKVGKLEARDSKTTSDKYEINGVPTFIIFKDGKQVDKVEGERTKQQLIDMINKNLK